MQVKRKHVVALLLVCLLGIGSFIMNEDLWYAVNPINTKDVVPKP